MLSASCNARNRCVGKMHARVAAQHSTLPTCSRSLSLSPIAPRLPAISRLPPGCVHFHPPLTHSLPRAAALPAAASRLRAASLLPRIQTRPQKSRASSRVAFASFVAQFPRDLRDSQAARSIPPIVPHRSVARAGFSLSPIGPISSSSLLCLHPPLYSSPPQLPQSVRL